VILDDPKDESSWERYLDIHAAQNGLSSDSDSDNNSFGYYGYDSDYDYDFDFDYDYGADYW